MHTKQDHNVMVDGRNFFDQAVKNDRRTHKNIEKLQLVKVIFTQLVLCEIILTSKKYYKVIAIDLRKQKELDADPKAIQKVNFTGNIDQGVNKMMFFIIEEAKKLFWIFCKEL